MTTPHLVSTRFLVNDPAGRQFVVYARDPFKAVATITQAEGLRVFPGTPLAGPFEIVGSEGGAFSDGSYDFGGKPAKLVTDSKPDRETRR
jgi:hypothetical protein